MQSNFFGDSFARENIAVVVPNDAEQEYIHDKLMSEIELGIFNEATRQELTAIIARMKNRDGIDAVILGCTELPLILSSDISEVPLLNTTEIHVAAICRRCMASA